MTNIPDKITNFSMQMPFSLIDHDSFFFSRIFFCLPDCNVNTTFDVFDFDLTNFLLWKLIYNKLTG